MNKPRQLRALELLADNPEKERWRANIEKGLCPDCGKDPKLEPLSFDPREVQLSGLCNECWDKLFSED